MPNLAPHAGHTLTPMGARSIPPPPLFVRRVLHVLWPFVGVVVTGLMVPVIRDTDQKNLHQLAIRLVFGKG